LHGTATAALKQGSHVTPVVNAASEACVTVGLRVRLGGRPGAIAFELPADDRVQDADLIKLVRSKVLRRVEDRSTSARPFTSISPAVSTTVASVLFGSHRQ